MEYIVRFFDAKLLIFYNKVAIFLAKCMFSRGVGRSHAKSLPAEKIAFVLISNG